MTQITDAMLKEWEGLCEKATPEPWVARESRTGNPTVGPLAYSGNLMPYVTDDNDARFIAAARTALPLLLAEVRKLDVLAALLRQHRCNSDGAMTVSKCVDSGRCACSCGVLAEVRRLRHGG